MTIGFNLIIVAIAVICHISSSQDFCKNNWESFQDSCYHINEMYLGFNEAQQQCEQEGADLTSIHSNEEQEFHRTLMESGLVRMDSWIGLNDIEFENAFRWTDGSQNNFDNFGPGLPTPRKAAGQDCVHIDSNNEYKWDDESCFTPKQFICKRQKDCEDYSLASETFLADTTIPVQTADCLDISPVLSHLPGQTQIDTSTPNMVVFQFNSGFDHRIRTLYRFDFDTSLLNSEASTSPEYSFGSVLMTEIPFLSANDPAIFSIVITIIPNDETMENEIYKRETELRFYNNTLSFTLEPPVNVGPGRIRVSLSVTNNYQFPSDIASLNGDSRIYFFVCVENPNANCNYFEQSWTNVTIKYDHLACLDNYYDLYGAYRIHCLGIQPVATTIAGIATTQGITEVATTIAGIATTQRITEVATTIAGIATTQRITEVATTMAGIATTQRITEAPPAVETTYDLSTIEITDKATTIDDITMDFSTAELTTPQHTSRTKPQTMTSSQPTSRTVTPKRTTTSPTESPTVTAPQPTDFIDRELGRLADVNVTADNVETVASNLTTLLTEDTSEIDDAQLEDISNILNDIVAVKDPSINVTTSVVNTVNSIIDSYADDPGVTTVSAAPNQIQRALEQQISTLQTNPGNATISTQNLAIQAVKVPPESLVNTRLVFEAVPKSNGELNTTVTARKQEEQAEKEVEAAISFQLPDHLVTNITEIAVSLFVYNDASLFPSSILTNKSSGDTMNVQRIVGSRVISATVEGIEVTNLPLDNPVETVFALNQVNDNENEIEKTNATECVFWDESASNGLGDWSPEGCYYNRTLEDGRVVCHCTHLTSFAVLVDIHGKPNLILDILSKIGCGLSITFLLITLITYLASRKLRRVKPKKILISLCVSLLCLYLVFVIGVEKGNKSDAGCTAVSALLHYFTLTSIAWMAVEAFHMYVSFVKVVGRWSYISKFILKASLLAWGIPAVIVIIALIVDIEQYNNTHCFLKIGYTFYFSHLLVLALVICINMVIFGIVMHKLTCGRMATSSKKNKEEERKEIKKRVQNAIAISLLMGLTWVFGLFSLLPGPISFVFQLFFCIFNSLQGAFIFVMFCLRQPEVIAIWKRWIFCNADQRTSKDHRRMDMSQSSGFVSDTTHKGTESSFASSKM